MGKIQFCLLQPSLQTTEREDREMQSALPHTGAYWTSFTLTMRQMGCQQILILAWSNVEATRMQTEEAPWDQLTFLPVLKFHKGHCHSTQGLLFLLASTHLEAMYIFLTCLTKPQLYYAGMGSTSSTAQQPAKLFSCVTNFHISAEVGQF